MTTLTHLVLNGTKLSELPPDIGFLSSNSVSISITKKLFNRQLRFLEKLELGNNQIYKLPMELGRLTKLEELSLTGNPLRSIPPHMGMCFSVASYQ